MSTLLFAWGNPSRGDDALGPALLDPTRPILHVAGALRIDRFGGRESVRLQIDDAAAGTGSILA